ncbi:hydantoinase/oxoprolinase family protein [Rubinisphaera margarita]|uniref:hydantoinase/oxoprolinase family protein n=1 Tax=Rubinisphaera margarita TaxID=2909586 RepID=UPI001EE89694|nr:hydantoinase/oxoprolinase family protein [Rubinisphaera margarita]MCG6156681.1 hypothetical protein [Rubinisphaera margarita]
MSRIDNIIGIDLGGANIKFADAYREAFSLPFPLWTAWKDVSNAIQQELTRFRPARLIVLTMTGELADCFASQSEGVEYLTDAVVAAAGDLPVFVWQTSREFAEPEMAKEYPRLTAAANWMALATWTARVLAPETCGLLIDIGSTTTDLIPLQNGVAIPTGLTDFERLHSGELVYTGGLRTPVCAVAQSVTVDGNVIGLAAELFATMHDVALLLGDIPEDPAESFTADGRPAMIVCARQRLARMLCSDADSQPETFWLEIARQLRERQLEQISVSLQRVLDSLPASPRSVVISGSCEFLVREVIRREPRLQDVELVSVSQALGPQLSTAACAYALTQLAIEQRI